MKTAYSVEQLTAIAQAAQEYVVTIRRELHAHPETRYETEFTRGVILREICSMNPTVERHPCDLSVPNVVFGPIQNSKGGIVINIGIVGAKEVDRILFRADFDGLPLMKGDEPIMEQTDLPFRSQIKGRIHSCGHDMHTAMLLGFLKCIAEGKIVPTKNLRIVFQDAEENPDQGESGGAALVREGVLRDVSEAHALHIWAEDAPRGKPGVFYSVRGPMLGYSDRLKVIVKATGGHVMQADGLPNALDVAADINVFLRQLASEYPSKSVSLRAAYGIGGTKKGSNMMPAETELMFAARSYFSKSDQLAFRERIRTGIEKVVAASPGASVEIIFIDGHPALINSEHIYDEDRRLLEGAGQVIGEMKRELGGEDMAWYGESQGGAPLCMWMLGAYQHGFGGHHTATFNPDESVMWRGVLFWLLQATK